MLQTKKKFFLFFFVSDPQTKKKFESPNLLSECAGGECGAVDPIRCPSPLSSQVRILVRRIPQVIELATLFGIGFLVFVTLR
jgi:hypothetical protein